MAPPPNNNIFGLSICMHDCLMKYEGGLAIILNYLYTMAWSRYKE